MHSLFFHTAKLPLASPNTTENTLPAPAPPPLSANESFFQLLQQMAAVQHQAFSYLAGSPQNQATSSLPAPLNPTQSVPSVSNLAGSLQTQAGVKSSPAQPAFSTAFNNLTVPLAGLSTPRTVSPSSLSVGSSSPVHLDRTQSASSTVLNDSRVSPAGLSIPSSFSPIVLNQSGGPITNFQLPALVQHVNPATNPFTFAPIATTGPSQTTPLITVSPAGNPTKTEESALGISKDLTMSSRPIASPKQRRIHQPANVSGSNYQDPIENRHKLAGPLESPGNPHLFVKPHMVKSGMRICSFTWTSPQTCLHVV
jgi:hypothetical protein